MASMDLGRVVFRKSSYSDGGNGCVETGTLGSQHLVRDSKNPEGGVLALDRDVWSALVSRIRRGAYDL
ncbi:DUF397 domain-containing protein [Actinomadura sp. 7K507]|nr:DUF397 domain-containing protein [Actinomadura sp. 7K507]